MFVSDIYGGRASDNFIFNDSGILMKCEKGDGIMADRGYTVDDECHAAGVKLFRPPFKERGKEQLPYFACEVTRGIAAARVHVERCIERVKNFKILKSNISWNMFPYVKYIINVIAGLVNLCGPILSENKF